MTPQAAANPRKQPISPCRQSRSGGDADLLNRIATDKRIGLGKKRLTEILAENERFVGAAPHQVDAFVANVEPLVKRQKGAADYQPGKLL